MSNHVEAIESTGQLIARFVDQVIAIASPDHSPSRDAEKVEGIRMLALDYARLATATIEGLDESGREDVMASLRLAIDDRLANRDAIVVATGETSVVPSLRPELREALMATFEQDEAAYRYLGR